MEIWSKLGKRIKQIVSVLKADFKKEAEDGLLLDGLRKLLLQISGQNNDNMNAMVASLKESFPKTDTASLSVSSPSIRTTKLTKPAKVPNWSRDMTLFFLFSMEFRDKNQERSCTPTYNMTFKQQI